MNRNKKKGKKYMAEKVKERKQKIKRPMDKRRIIQSIVIIILVLAMILSIAGSLIYYLVNQT